jgi:CubicO group peptidase (beta-lactamase class C family)
VSALVVSPASRLSPQATPDPRLSALIRSVDSATADRAKTSQFSGVVRIARVGPDSPADGTLLYERAIGVADRDGGVPISPTTKFVTASVAQTFVAVAVAQLVERGAVELDATASRYLPDSIVARGRLANVTVRQLLNHTAGFGSLVANRQFRADPGKLVSLDGLVALVAEDTARDAPGRFRYADADYTILGKIVERVSGEPFAAYMRDHVFRPAGMMDSGFDLWPRPPSLARGYTVRNTGDPRFAASSSTGGAASHPNDAILPHVGIPGSVAYTTAPDLVRFADALLRDRLVAHTALLWSGEMQTGQADANRGFGLGFFVGQVGNAFIVNHGGTGPGIDNAFDIYPNRGYVVVVLTNLDPPAAQEVRRLSRDGMSAPHP